MYYDIQLTRYNIQQISFRHRSSQQSLNLLLSIHHSLFIPSPFFSSSLLLLPSSPQIIFHYHTIVLYKSPAFLRYCDLSSFYRTRERRALQCRKVRLMDPFHRVSLLLTKAPRRHRPWEGTTTQQRMLQLWLHNINNHMDTTTTTITVDR